MRSLMNLKLWLGEPVALAGWGSTATNAVCTQASSWPKVTCDAATTSGKVLALDLGSLSANSRALVSDTQLTGLTDLTQLILKSNGAW